MSKDKRTPPRKVTLEEWKEKMLAKAPTSPSRRNYAPGWRRRAAHFKIMALRWRLAKWIAGVDLDEW